MYTEEYLSGPLRMANLSWQPINFLGSLWRVIEKAVFEDFTCVVSNSISSTTSLPPTTHRCQFDLYPTNSRDTPTYSYTLAAPPCFQHHLDLRFSSAENTF